MFYMAILFYSIVNGLGPTHWAPNGIEWWFILSTFAFLHGLHPETVTSVVPGGWSIAVEMTFYLVLPILLPLLNTKVRCFLFLLFALGLSGVNYVLVPYIFSYPENQQYLLRSFSFLNFFGQLPVFVIGIFGYLIISGQHARSQTLCWSTFGLVGFAFLFFYPILGFPKNEQIELASRMLRHILAAGMFCALAIFLAHLPVKALVNKLFVMFGKLSFSMYLIHFAVIDLSTKIGGNKFFAKEDMPSIYYALGITLITAAIAYLFYKKVELPGIDLGKKWIAKLDQSHKTVGFQPKGS